MVELNGSIAPTAAPTAHPVATPAPVANAASGQTAPTTDQTDPAKSSGQPVGTAATAAKSDAKKPEHTTDVVIGFNPSTRIDPDTHMVVLTIRDDSGKTLRQIPNEHELAAYKAELGQHKK